jgi:hypothetical protein
MGKPHHHQYAQQHVYTLSTWHRRNEAREAPLLRQPVLPRLRLAQVHKHLAHQILPEQDNDVIIK